MEAIEAAEMPGGVKGIITKHSGTWSVGEVDGKEKGDGGQMVHVTVAGNRAGKS